MEVKNANRKRKPMTDSCTGIIRCDMIAESIIAAADELGPLRVPIVVRLQGTNAEQGQQMVSAISLQDNGKLIYVTDCRL